ncbi:unnamed protein product, partial [Adineta steineri]
MLFDIFILLLIFCSEIKSQIQKHDPDCDLNITQLIQSKGYPCEEHKILTNDGYILGVFRIPYGRNGSLSTIGRPVLLQHGLLDSATTWVMNFPDQSLGYILADAGYDVWLGNVRGNYYSRAHTKYDPNHDEEFWDFSWDDMARDDLPSMIYYILNMTQHAQIGYIGHSQGTMIGFAGFGHPDSILQNSVSFYGALAPVAHLGHIRSPIKYLSSTTKELELYWHLLFGRNEFLPSSYIIKWLGIFACGEIILDHILCQNILFILCGPEKKNMNETRIPVYIAHEPDGTSVKNMIHFAQGVQTNQFQAYDYGSAQKNQLHYNQTTPPEYDLQRLKIPTAIFYSGKDWLADPVDVAYIFDNLQNLVYEKYTPEYNHLDFVWALSANKIIYYDLLNVMKKYHPYLSNLLFFVLLFYSVSSLPLREHDPDCDLNITQLIQSKGYPCEEHKILTNDGYILGVFRIPFGRNGSSSTIGRPVLLQHGLLDAAVTWIMNFPDQSLAFMLADVGYDVWLGNVRGNYYSRAHTKYDPDRDIEFWDFSWDDMARDDLP